ncbi:hypothetical protein XELAEV_18037317mg [Xenopus laevis]|uniref:Uncharacterized protein n=1 Tax=Xenopus laevis TaxID=8355 RepID=A0A974HA24_XENLA|nr:hypothetical protein XELAEV_18037317mg [Xenopus laevis]
MGVHAGAILAPLPPEAAAVAAAPIPLPGAAFLLPLVPSGPLPPEATASTCLIGKAPLGTRIYHTWSEPSFYIGSDFLIPTFTNLANHRQDGDSRFWNNTSALWPN